MGRYRNWKSTQEYHGIVNKHRAAICGRGYELKEFIWDSYKQDDPKYRRKWNKVLRKQFVEMKKDPCFKGFAFFGHGGKGFINVLGSKWGPGSFKGMQHKLDFLTVWGCETDNAKWGALVEHPLWAVGTQENVGTGFLSGLPWLPLIGSADGEVAAAALRGWIGMLPKVNNASKQEKDAK